VAPLLFNLGGTRLEIRTTSPRFASWVGVVLAEHRVPPDGVDDPLLSIVVEDGPPRSGGRRFHLLYRRTSTIVRTLQIGTIAKTFLSELDRIGLPLRDDAVHLDGAIVDVRGVAVLVPGSLVPLVSTLGHRAEREGIRLPGHTILTLDEEGRVAPTPRGYRTAGDALSRLAGFYGSPSSIDRATVEHVIEPTVIFQLAGEPNVALRSVSRGLTLHRLATMTMNLPVVGGSALRRLGALVGRAQGYETTWAGKLKISDALIRAVENHARHPYVIRRTEDTPWGR
jgi:hypothetical protein